MRQPLAVLSLLVAGAGCSWIYNPNNIANKIDAKVFSDGPVDVPVDVELVAPPDPANLMLTSVVPATIDEGRGSNGSRPALLVLRGSNFDGSPSANLAVTLTPDDGGPALTFETTVAGDHNWIALGVTAAVDSSCGDGTSHKYTVGVDEDGAPQIQQLTGAVTLACHDELTGSTLATPTKAMYSQVDVTGNLTITGTAPAIIKSASTIEIGGTVSVDASGQTAGPGGQEGGAVGSDGAGAGAGAGAVLGGGGAGFHDPGTAASSGGAGGAMIGDVPITSYAMNYASGGGGSGTLGLGGTGGGGGGTIELTAYGDITLLAVSAKGGSASAAASGAGAGGLIVIRPLGGILHGAVTLGVAAGATGNAGSRGRTRVDGATDSAIVADYHGPMLTTLPLVSVGNQTPMVTAVGPPTPTVAISGLVIDAANNAAPFMFTPGPAGPNGYGNAMPMLSLTAGWNKVCVMVEGGNASVDVAANCVEMAFLP